MSDPSTSDARRWITDATNHLESGDHEMALAALTDTVRALIPTLTPEIPTPAELAELARCGCDEDSEPEWQAGDRGFVARFTEVGDALAEVGLSVADDDGNPIRVPPGTIWTVLHHAAIYLTRVTPAEAPPPEPVEAMREAVAASEDDAWDEPVDLHKVLADRGWPAPDAGQVEALADGVLADHCPHPSDDDRCICGHVYGDTESTDQHLARAVLAAGWRQVGDDEVVARVLADLDINRACEVMHDAYEAAATEQGWKTQKRSRKPWAEVPDANQATMQMAVMALVEHVAGAALDTGATS